MINYSIIIPHKNIPDLLQRCLDSIPRRDDVQIIVVDDNSDDNKVDFTNFPGLNDPYVEVVFGKNENGRKGAGYARNLGLERAKGKWLVFADADDFFMPCFDEVLDKYVSDNNDIIYFFLNSVYSDTLEKANRVEGINKLLSDALKTHVFDFKYKITSCWGRLIKREIVGRNNISFQEVLCYNDVLFALKLSILSNQIKIAKEIIYCATDRSDSLSTEQTSESLQTRFNVWYETNRYLKENKVEVNANDYICRCWLRIWRLDKRIAVMFLPKMVSVCDIKIFVEVLTHDYPKLQKYWLWRGVMKKVKIR